MQQNPWLALDVERPPYVLPEDEVLVAAANARCRARGDFDKYGFQLQCLPDAFTGSILAPVVVVTLNPGYTKPEGPLHTANDDWWNANRPDFREAYRKNLHQEPTEFPFFFLNPLFRGNPGYVYWSKALRELIELCDVRRVARNLLVVESFPYHSESYRNTIAVPSQAFAHALVQSAIERGAEIIIWRKERELIKSIPELLSYDYQTVNAPISPYLSSGNVRNWPRFVKAIQDG